MTGINTQGNTPPTEKRIDRSERYLNERARQQDQFNRGAPDLVNSPVETLHQPQPQQANDSFFTDLLISLEKIDPTKLVKSTIETSIMGCKHKIPVWSYDNKEIKVEMRLSELIVESSNKNNPFTVVISYDRLQSQIKMGLLIKNKIRRVEKSFDLELDSNLKTILEIPFKPTE